MRQKIVGVFPMFKTVWQVMNRVILVSLALVFGTSLYCYAQLENKKNFHISAQSLSTALLTFGEQADLSLLVRKKDTDGKTSTALQGKLYPREVLRLLLRDTKLGFKYIDRKTVSISPDLFKQQQPDNITRKDASPKAQDLESEPDLYAPIDEVVVTSLRRKSNMQKAPVAVTVIKPPLIREARIHGLQDVGARVPGLTVASFSIGQPTIHMRGVGSNDDGAALDNSIVMFVDDVYVGRITAISMNQHLSEMNIKSQSLCEYYK